MPVFLQDKVVLVTGAGGSIGSELCRQILEQRPEKLVLFEHSELALYQIERELDHPAVVPVLGDVANESDVAFVFYDHDFDFVYHAAAYKHVRMCELNQAAAWRVNSYGTRVLAQQARRRDVPTFILVSTDKAVRPTSLMGKTKQQAEMYTLEAGYTVVRLGNVYASSGSVIPLWKEQIAAGKPVTITDPKATRYFIDVDEAALRIIEASARAYGGDVYVPDMGIPERLRNVALDLGARAFHVIGLQPGEKLHEELFNGRMARVCPGLYRDAA